jgi:hypothetical protein
MPQTFGKVDPPFIPMTIGDMCETEQERVAKGLLIRHDGGDTIMMSVLFMMSKIPLTLLTLNMCGTHSSEEYYLHFSTYTAMCNFVAFGIVLFAFMRAFVTTNTSQAAQKNCMCLYRFRTVTCAIVAIVYIVNMYVMPCVVAMVGAIVSVLQIFLEIYVFGWNVPQGPLFVHPHEHAQEEEPPPQEIIFQA